MIDCVDGRSVYLLLLCTIVASRGGERIGLGSFCVILRVAFLRIPMIPMMADIDYSWIV